MTSIIRKKQFPKFMAALLLSLLLCIPAVLAVFYYTKPMEDAYYDLSLLPGDGQAWEGDKGWTLFVQDGTDRSALLSDGTGGYQGLTHAGQTFYYSRPLTEDLDSPTLQIDTANRTVSVFLDGALIYTDCPELDNRIGYLQLPMLDYDRTEPLSISLPADYAGKTLTIAQSTYAEGVSEKQTPDDEEASIQSYTVYPCNVTLYCGYSYESGLIAKTASAMIPASLLLGLLFVLLGFFLFHASLGRLTPALPVLSLTVLFQICRLLTKTSFFFKYFGTLPVDLSVLFFHLSIAGFVAFLAFYAKKLKPFFLLLALLQLLSTGVALATQAGYVLPYGDLYVRLRDLPYVTGFLSLLLCLICSLVLCLRGHRFFKRLCQAALTLVVCFGLFLLVSIPFAPGYAAGTLRTLVMELTLLTPNRSLQLLWDLCLFAALYGLILELADQETERRTEETLLLEKSQLAMESYESLRRHSEEVLMLRHDTAKHYLMLSRMAKETPEKLSDYLDGLTEQVADIRPVASTGNQMLDIILNSKLSLAAEKGIPVELVRASAPEHLPLSDAEASCLFLNILDNALNALSAPDMEKPFLKLDIHCKGQHFVFTCENAVSPKKVSKEDKSHPVLSALAHEKKPIPAHGYGLKIIRQIMKKYGDMVCVEETKGCFRISVVLPLTGV